MLGMGENRIEGLTFCITGKTRNDRALYWAFITECGGRWVKRVSGAVNVLVCGDDAGPKKLEEAEKLGIEMCTEEVLENAIREALDYPEGSLLAKGWRLPIRKEVKKGVIAGRRFCITGDTKRWRCVLEREIEKRGGKCLTTVTRLLDVLVAGTEPGPCKMKQAQEQGAEIWTEEQLEKELEEAEII